MTPEEIAREIVDKWWGLPEYIKTPPPEYERLVALIADALAASEQRWEIEERDANIAELIDARDDLRAQLQASERALERVRAVVNAAQKRIHLHDGLPHAYNAILYGTTGRIAGCKLCDALANYDAALVSPESPQ